jgi:2-keto-4-pentenoate hydratase/2-oxohepta-3-ene-1,7-dioic acid hydratase in catechol pathway
MKLASYARHGHKGVALVEEGRLIDVTALVPDAPRTMRELLAWLPGHGDRLNAARDETVPTIGFDEVELLPVVDDPHAIWCAALTYMSHVREGGDRPVPAHPLFFLRVAASQVGHRGPLVIPRVSDELDYEGELAVVIGTAGRHIPQSRALDHVAGFTCYNDGSVRDWQRHTPQITPGKNFESTGACGPWLVTRDEFGDPYRHRMQTRVNGEVVQSAAISELLFSIEYMVEYLSTICTLQVGDVIVTGTSGGVGLRRTPPYFLKPGDQVEVEIDGIGTLVNPVRKEEADR